MYKDLRKPKAEAWQGDEQLLQKETARFVKKALYTRGLPQLAFHVANERKAKIQEHNRLKLQGVLPGVSDWIILIPRQGYHGLVIELKNAGGAPIDNHKDKLSEEQIKFLKGADEQGYLCLVINDLKTFENTVNFYLD